MICELDHNIVNELREQIYVAAMTAGGVNMVAAGKKRVDIVSPEGATALLYAAFDIIYAYTKCVRPLRRDELLYLVRLSQTGGPNQNGIADA